MLVGQKWTPTNQLHNTLHSEMTGLTFGQPTHNCFYQPYLILSYLPVCQLLLLTTLNPKS